MSFNTVVLGPHDSPVAIWIVLKAGRPGQVLLVPGTYDVPYEYDKTL